jgi:hypothetical protein
MCTSLAISIVAFQMLSSSYGNKLRESQDSQSKELLMKWITSEDPADEKTFDGGFDALVKWCREQTNAEQSIRQAWFSLCSTFVGLLV